MSFDQVLMAAVLAAGNGAAISHRAAASVWALHGLKAARPEISIPHSRRIELEGVIVHRVKALPQSDITRYRGLIVTTAARTLIDIAGLLTEPGLEDALDDGLRRRLFTLASLEKQLQGRTRNTAALRRLLKQRKDGVVSGSAPENSLRRLFERAGLQPPVIQFEINDGRGRFLARVDFAYPDHRLAIEYDGQHHADRRQWSADLVRQNRLINSGWRILRYTHDDLVHRRDEVVEEVRTALKASS